MNNLTVNLPLLALGGAVLLPYFIYENNHVSVSHIKVQSAKIPTNFKGFKILHLTDLHGKTFGTDNIHLLAKINAVNPDIIVASGDMFSTSLDKKCVFLNLCKSLKKKYPIYYSIGNHEIIVKTSQNGKERVWYNRYLNKLKEAGVTILDDEKISLIKNKDRINIYGLTLPLKYYKRRFSPSLHKGEILTAKYIDSLLSKPKSSEFNILLAHNPLNFPTYLKWGSDLIFSGHVHGGIIRLPIVKGLLSPEVSFFPKYKEGIYTKDNGSMIVGRGLGNSSIKFRIFNPPEIIEVILE